MSYDVKAQLPQLLKRTGDRISFVPTFIPATNVKPGEYWAWDGDFEILLNKNTPKCCNETTGHYAHTRTGGGTQMSFTTDHIG